MAETGIKLDADKTRLDLLDAEWLEEVGKVLTFGAKKYSAENWRGGISYSRLYAAALRHLMAFKSGVELDSETGLSHLAHASCCLQFLHWMHNHRRDLDDRWKAPVNESVGNVASYSPLYINSDPALQCKPVGHDGDVSGVFTRQFRLDI